MTLGTGSSLTRACNGSRCSGQAAGLLQRVTMTHAAAAHPVLMCAHRRPGRSALANCERLGPWEYLFGLTLQLEHDGYGSAVSAAVCCLSACSSGSDSQPGLCAWHVTRRRCRHPCSTTAHHSKLAFFDMKTQLPAGHARSSAGLPSWLSLCLSSKGSADTLATPIVCQILSSHHEVQQGQFLHCSVWHCKK